MEMDLKSDANRLKQSLSDLISDNSSLLRSNPESLDVTTNDRKSIEAILSQQRSAPGMLARSAGLVMKSLRQLHDDGADRAQTLAALEPYGPLIFAILGYSIEHGPDRPSKVLAAVALHTFGSEAAPAVEPLTRALSQKPMITHVVKALELIGPPAWPAVPRLVEILQSDTGELDYFLLTALASIGAPNEIARAALEKIVPNLSDRLPWTSRHGALAASVLGKAGAAGAIAKDRLLSCFQGTESEQYAIALTELGFGTPDLAEPIARVLKCGNEVPAWIKRDAARALEILGHASVSANRS